MDFGKLFGDIGRNVGNFFGGGNQKKKDEDELLRQQQAQAAQPKLPLGINGGTVQAPKSFVPVAPKLGGTTVQQPKKPAEPNLIEKLGAGLQQAGGQLGDAIIQGGLVTGKVADDLNPFLSGEQRQKRLDEQLAITEKTRSNVRELKDVTGQSIVGNEDIAEQAGRIAAGQGDLRDFSTLAGRGLDIGNTATSFINPLRVASGVQAGIRPTIREVAPFIAKEAGLYGTTNAAAAGADTYGATGDPIQAAQQAAIGFLTGAVPQLGLEGAALGFRRALTGVEGSIPTRGLRRSEDVAESGVEQRPTTLEAPTPEPTQARDPNSPITESPTTDKAPAITSPNQAGALQAPQVGGTVAQPGAAGIVPNTTPTVQAPQTDPALLEQLAKIEQQKVVETPAPVVQAPEANVLEAPSVTQSRTMAQEVTPVSPEVIQQAVAREAADQAPSFSVPTLEVGGKMKFAKPSVAGDPKAVYGADDPNLAQIARSAVVAAKGTAATAGEHADALRKAGFTDADIKAVRNFVVKNADKNTGKVDSDALRAFIEARGNKVEAPTKTATVERVPDETPPTDSKAPEPVDELGDIARKSIVDGTVKRGDIQDRISTAVEAAAEKAGTTWEAINKKVQKAYTQKKSWDEAGLTPEESDVFKRYSNELNTMRDRVDPSLLGEGNISPFYSPRQEFSPDGEFDASLVNERSRDRKGGLSDADLDLSVEPTRDYVKRYADAPSAMADNFINEIENTVKDNGDVIPTGVKVPDETKAKLKEGLEKYVNLKDESIKAADSGDAASLQKIVDDADKELNDILTELATDVRGLDGDSKQAVKNLIDTRKAYIQSTVRTNMFLNLANRAYDQAQKGIIQGSDRLLGNLANKITGNKIGGTVLAVDKDSLNLAKKYSKGTLNRNIARDFKTSTQLATAGTKGIGKAFAWLDGVYRAAGTAFTSFGDLTTSAAKVANLRILQEAQEKGITGAKELENYLVRERSTPAYQSLLRDAQNQYMGYTGIPQTVTAANKGDNKFVKFLSSVDNAVNKGLDKTKVPDRVKRELNDIIMPAATGFAGATARIAGKQLNALGLGIYGFKKGAKLAASDAPNAKAVGQLMMTRSLIDGIMAGGTMTGGLILGATGQWTGGYPDDPNERARWEKDGIQENAIPVSVGDKTLYIQPGRILGVLALPLVLPTVIANAIRTGTDPGDAAGQVIEGTIGQFVENFGVESLVGHLDDITKLGTGSESQKEDARKNLMNMLGFSIANAITPAAGLTNNVANAVDPVKRDTSGGMIDFIKNRNPFTRPTLDVKKDNLGNPIENNTQISGGSAAISLGGGTKESQASNPLDAEINRLAAAKFETVPGKDVKNTNSQEDAKLLLDSPTYQKADDETKATLLKETLLGTKTKDINKDLPAESRASLIEYTIQNEAQRKAWLENNDNAASYYNASYSNAGANGTLTADDDNLQNKSGKKYLAVRADVNKEVGADKVLQNLYEDIDSSEFKAMLDPSSDDYDPDTAAKLKAYDDARTAKGVSGKSSDSSKPKYSTTGGGSGRGGKGFAFATMPASLIGTGGGESKYDKGGRLFKPIPDLEAPTKSNIPKSRSISVKRGVVI